MLVVGSEPLSGWCAGLRVERARRLSEALDALDRMTPDVIVTELHLPDSSGISTLQRLSQRASDVPIIVVLDVESDDDIDRQTLFQCGAAAYLPRQAVVAEYLAPLVESAIAGQRRSADLQRRESRLRIAVEGAGDGLWEWDFRSDEVYYSARFNEILGLRAEDTVDAPCRWLDRVHQDDLKVLRARLDAHLQRARGAFQCEHRLIDSHGEIRWVLARGRSEWDLDGEALRMAGFLMDITDRRRSEDNALHRSLHDELTGLANRGLFIDRVDRALAIPERDGGNSIAVLFVDLDHFKRVNDLYGHGAGDEVLREVSRRLNKVLRPGDTVARLGGDEFGILLTNVKETELAIHVAERILNLISDPVAVGRNELVVSASIGIATNETRYDDAPSVIEDADLAMYRAKSLGRSRYQVCNQLIHKKAISRIELEADLRLAVDDQQFVTHYQPIINLEDGMVLGVEAMVRWMHPERGLLRPGQFIDLAERSGVIIDLGWQVLESACCQVGRWRRQLPEAEHLFLGVNVSSKVLVEGMFIKRLESVLELACLPPEALVLELQEAVTLDHWDQVCGPIQGLKDLGVRLAVDDFGLKHGSLSQLDRQIFDMMKMDPTITNRVESATNGDHLPSSMIGVAEQMGVQVVAEGVETAEQLEALCGLGCRMAQGFWFAKPSDAETVEAAIINPPDWWIRPRDIWRSWEQRGPV